MTATTPELVVEFAFGAGALEDVTDGQWTQVEASKVVDVSTARGRSSEFDTYSAGTCTVTFEDTDREFDPLNTSGPHYGSLNPRTQMRVRAKVGSTYYDRWRGLVEAWRQSNGRQATYVTVEGCDAFKLLNQTRLPQSVYESAVLADSPWLYWRLGEADGAVAVDASGNRNDGIYLMAGLNRGAESAMPFGDGSVQTLATVTFGGVFPAHAAVKSDSAAACIASEPRTFEVWIQALEPLALPSGGPGATTTLTLWHQNHPTSAAARYRIYYQHVVAFDGTTIFTRLIAGNASSATVWLLPRRLDDGGRHHVVVVESSGTKTLFVNTQEVEVFTTTTETIDAKADRVWLGEPDATETWVGLLDEVAWYDSALTAQQVEVHYQAGTRPWAGDTSGQRIERILDLIGWPAGLRAVDAGEQILGNADLDGVSALSYLQLVAQTEGGRFFIDAAGNATFHDAVRFQRETVENTSQYTFSDDEAGDAVYSGGDFSRDDRELYNVATIQRKYGIPQTASDDTSIAAYGEQTYELSGLLHLSDSLARAQAERIVGRYKDPLSRVERWTVQPEVDAADWTDLLALEIGHRVTIEQTPAGTGSQITAELIVEQIGDQVSGDRWSITFWGTPVDPNEDSYFTWDGDGGTQGWGTGVWR